MNKQSVREAAPGAAAIIVAAGSGSRMKSNTKKQFMELCGKPVLYYALEAFSGSDVIDEIVLVASEEDISYCREALVDRFNIPKVKAIVPGGAERYLSVWNGLREVSEYVGYVMVHDAARPLIKKETIHKAYDMLKQVGACVTGVPAKDTIKQTGLGNVVVATPPRASLWTVQTPQCFGKELLLQAYAALWKDKENTALTDDAMIVEHYTGAKVYMLEGEYSNIKITTPEDIIIARALLEAEKSS